MKSLTSLLIVLITALALLTTSSCRKGRNLPVNVPVYIDTTGIETFVSEIYYWEYDMDLQYVNEKMRTDLVQAFYQDLQYYLKKNNCSKGDENSDYTVKVNSLSLTETITAETYLDTCGSYESGYSSYEEVFLSTVNYSSDIQVVKNGFLLGGYNERICKKEKTCGKNKCDRPRVKAILMGADGMRARVIKSQRKNITKAIHFDWHQSEQ
jgi:hypothetical protein